MAILSAPIPRAQALKVLRVRHDTNGVLAPARIRAARIIEIGRRRVASLASYKLVTVTREIAAVLYLLAFAVATVPFVQLRTKLVGT